MITNDYRNTEYCPMLENVGDKKKALEEKIRSAHPRQKIMYNKVHNRNLLGGLYRENPVKSRNYEAVKSSKKWENVGNSYIIPALLLYRYSYI